LVLFEEPVELIGGDAQLESHPPDASAA
jgi:hypothetical protein